MRQVGWGVWGSGRIDAEVGVGEGLLPGDPVGKAGGSEHEKGGVGKLRM